MGRVVLLDADGERVEMDEAESCDAVATLHDISGADFVKASVLSLTATLSHSDSSRTIINSRDDQDVLDTNGGYLSDVGVITLKLQPADNIIVDTPIDEVESHYLLFTWTWEDDDGDTRTGKQEYEIFVRSNVA